MPHVLLSVPEELTEQFIDHLGRIKPDIAKHITLRVLSDSHADEIINDFNECYRETAAVTMDPVDFPVHIPDNVWDDNLLPLEDLLDHTGRYTFSNTDNEEYYDSDFGV